MGSTRRTAAAFALAAGLQASSPGVARAESQKGFFPLAVGAVLVWNIGFTSYDIYVAGKGELPARGAAITQSVLFAVPSLAFTMIFSNSLLEERAGVPLTAIAVLAPTWSNALTVHGIWAVTSTRARPELLPALSLMVGADTTLTTFALAHAFNGRLFDRPLGVAAMLLTAPQIAVGIPSAIKFDRDRNAWIGAVSWSGALFLHGLVSTIVARPRPDPPPEALLPDRFPSAKTPLVVPGSIRLAPTVTTGDRGNAPGLVLTGALF